MKLTQTLSILRARRWLVFSVLMTTVAAGLAITFLLPPRYVATVSLVVDTKGTDPVTGALTPSAAVADIRGDSGRRDRQPQRGD